MTHRLRVNNWNDPTTISRVHIEHHRDLFLEFLLPVIRGEAPKPSGDEFFDDLEPRYFAWAESEFLRYAYVATYHFWEKQVRPFMRDQCAHVGVKWPPKGGLHDQVTPVLDATFDVAISPEVLGELDAGRAFTNAVKHGGGSKLRGTHPRFFPDGTDGADEDDLWAWSAVTADDVDRLCDAIAKFWEELGEQTERDFSMEGSA